MEGLNREGQWIVMMGFVVSFGIFFLALIINQSVLVGQTTSEGVLEFPKNDIQDFRHSVIESVRFQVQNGFTPGTTAIDMSDLGMARKSAVVSYVVNPADMDPSLAICGWSNMLVNITYDNGVTNYEERICVSPYGG